MLEVLTGWSIWTLAAGGGPPEVWKEVVEMASTAPKGAAATPLVRLAWRNLWRHRQRTVLLIVVVAYATLSTVIYWSIIDGYEGSVMNGYARYIAAPVRIASAAWHEDPDPEHALADLSVIEPVAQVRGVRAVAPRLVFPGLLQSSYAAVGAEIRGVDPAAEGRVSQIPNKIGEGRWLVGPGEVVLGKELAQRIDVRVGERVVVSAGALAGPQALGLTVVGLAETGVAGLDETLVVGHLEDARLLTGVATATTLALDVPRGREGEVARRVQEVLPPGLEARGAWDLVGPIKGDIEAGKAFALLLGLFLGLFAALAVASAIFVSVLERTREFGVIAALGLPPRRLGTLVTYEALLACAVGWGVGLVLGYGVAWVLASYNLLGPLLAATREGFQETGLADEFYGAVRPAYILYSAITVAVAVGLSALFPARRAARLQPAEAMRSA